jgi:hypothetical protein
MHPSNPSLQCVWGSQGMQAQETYEHGKHTRDLKWFRPPERKTLRPLCVVLLVSLSVSGTLESLCVLVF